MKIAILTQPLHTNYGGILQAYALQTFLENHGHEVIVVNRDYNFKMSPKLFLRRLGSVAKCIIRSVIFNQKEYCVMNPFSPYYHTKWTGYNVLPFVKKHINQTAEIRSTESLRNYFKQNKFDCYIVGSDQVWRPCYSPCITDFFLKEVPCDVDAFKLAYAASFGSDKWEFSTEETIECATLAKMFDAVSVREKSGVDLCKKYLHVEAKHLLDPTMLLEKEDYINLFQDAKVPKSKGNLFCYVLDNNLEADKIIYSLKEDGYIPNFISLSVNSTKENTRPYQLSVEEWLRGIYDSELVVTDSFHGCVFSILFSKPFIVVGNKYRGNARFESLLDMFGLQNRMVESYERFLKKKDSVIDDSDIRIVKKTLGEARTDSAMYLSHVISTRK